MYHSALDLTTSIVASNASELTGGIQPWSVKTVFKTK